jgi:phosphatidylinositol-3-phosphatase
MRGALKFIIIFAVLLVLVSCGGVTGGIGTSSNPTPSPSPSTSPSPSPSPSPGSGGGAAIGHIVLVVEENHSYGDVIGNSAMPYLNSLASQYSLATQYYANAHPSIGNYFMLTTGQLVSVDDAFTGTTDVNNIVRILNGAGRTWKAYEESIPSIGYLGGNSGAYLKRHDPFAYFSDVVNDSNEAAHLVPFTQFTADLASNSLPNFSFVTPNINDDAHNGSLQQADSWLKNNIGPLLGSSQFQQDGLLIIVFDEGDDFDLEHVGGHVPAILVGPSIKRGYQSSTFYQHQSTLRLILTSLGITSLPGSAAGAPDMGEFIQK